jgi:hypothetical protein
MNIDATEIDRHPNHYTDEAQAVVAHLAALGCCQLAELAEAGFVEGDNVFSPDNETVFDWAPEAGRGVRREDGSVFRPLQLVVDTTDGTITVR